jgi:hypothetical protein
VAYVGNQPSRGAWRKLTDISGSFNGVTTTFTTSVPPGTSEYYVTAGTASQLLISVGGVIQQPDVDYTVNTNSITFTTAPAAGLTFFGVLCGDALNTGTPADGSITTAKLAGGLSVGLTAGSASTAALYFTGDANTGLYSPGADELAIATGGTGRLTIDASGNVNIDSNTLYVDAANNRVGLGTSSPQALLNISASSGGDGSGLRITRTDAGGGDWRIWSSATVNGEGAGKLIFGNSSNRVTIDGSGNVGIGTTSPASALHVVGTGRFYSGTEAIQIYHNGTTSYLETIGSSTTAIGFANGGTEKARIDSSGRLLVGTSSARSNFLNSTFTSRFQVEGTDLNTGSAAIIRNDGGNGAFLILGSSGGTSTGSNTLVPNDVNNVSFGAISFQGTDGTEFVEAAKISTFLDGTPGANDMPGRLVFSTTADGASSPTERMRIDNSGAVIIGPPTANFNSAGVVFNSESAPGQAWFTRNNSYVAWFNRLTSDGEVIQIAQDSTKEGNISVSGTTVSYNGAHLSRWSQLPGGAERTEILRGTVLSNIDEMCGWGEEANEQLNRMKVSDVEGDPNVAGVFQAWDDDDDIYTDDFYCAMTGDMIIRIAEGVTVQRGDLLMSAGDGTAKPQDDDIIRSKTVAKVTSTHVTCTYDDGSYCVPCVLMAC